MERWRPRRLARLRPAADGEVCDVLVLPGNSGVCRGWQRDAARPAGETPAFL